MDSKRLANNRSGKASKKVIVLALSLIAVIVTAVIFAVANIPKDVTILDGNTSIKITTNEKDPQKIIEDNGFKLGKYDVLDSSQFEMQNSVLIIKREMTVLFCENGGEAWKVSLPARTVDDVLAYLNITLGEGDVVEPSGFEIIEPGSRITLFKAGEATLTVDGVSTTVLTSNKTVADILKENNITLDADDVVKPLPETVVSSGSEIVVTRVEYKELTKKEKIEYKTVKKNDASLAKGTEKEVSEGKAGEKQTTYKIRYENGKAVKKEVIAEKVITKPVNKGIAVGTASNSSSGSGSVKGLKYKAKYTGIASAYYEPAGNLTASGMKVGVGRIGVNPNIIPYGTKLYVTGYGYCVAADCGWGTIGMGRLADLYFGSEAECEAWGLRTVTMYVLD